jgi:hypothetical protein
MKTINAMGAGASNIGEASYDAIHGDIKNLLTSYANVTFVKTVTTTNGNRDVYEIDGIDGYYFTLENQATSNAYIDIRVYVRGNEETSTYIDSYTTQWVGDPSTKTVSNPFYAFSKNNVLYAFATAPQGGLPTGYVAFFEENNAGYMCIRNICAIDDTNHTKAYISQYAPNVNFAETEKALSANAIITTTNNSSNTNLLAVLTKIKKFITTTFNSTNSFTLIDVNGTKYRQVYTGSIFIDNGDDDA